MIKIDWRKRKHEKKLMLKMLVADALEIFFCFGDIHELALRSTRIKSPTLTRSAFLGMTCCIMISAKKVSTGSQHASCNKLTCKFLSAAEITAVAIAPLTFKKQL